MRDVVHKLLIGAASLGLFLLVLILKTPIAWSPWISFAFGATALAIAYKPGRIVFRARAFGIPPRDEAKIIPQWFGRLWCTAIGLLFIYFGVRQYLRR